jgi:hypothetical protein
MVEAIEPSSLLLVRESILSAAAAVHRSID